MLALTSASAPACRGGQHPRKDLPLGARLRMQNATCLLLCLTCAGDLGRRCPGYPLARSLADLTILCRSDASLCAGLSRVCGPAVPLCVGRSIHHFAFSGSRRTCAPRVGRDRPPAGTRRAGVCAHTAHTLCARHWRRRSTHHTWGGCDLPYYLLLRHSHPDHIRISLESTTYLLSTVPATTPRGGAVDTKEPPTACCGRCCRSILTGILHPPCRSRSTFITYASSPLRHARIMPPPPARLVRQHAPSAPARVT